MKDATEIVVVLDRSGSMAVIRKPTIEGFNEFLSKQKATPGDANITLVQFNHQYQVDYRSQDVQRVGPLNEMAYVPQGMTAMNDAIGKTIVDLGSRLASLQESERPDKIVFVIMTDGQENSSKEYTGTQVKQMIEEQTNKYNWQFLYVGANQDAVLTGAKFGILHQNAMTYGADTIGTRAAFSSISCNVASYRKTGNSADLIFTEEDRKKQETTK